MEYESKDIDVIHLLKKLKESNGAYPQEMLASRRQGYLKQVAEISGAAGLTMGLRNTGRGGGRFGAAPAAGTLVEALLVVAILAEGSAVAYFYRDKVVDFLQGFSNSPKVEVATEAPEAASPIPVLDFTATPVMTATRMTTETPTPVVGTPTAEMAAQATQQSEDGSGSTPDGNTHSSVSTPNPNDNNGNQYGLTPKPERTREPGNDNSEEQQERNPPGSNRNRK